MNNNDQRKFYDISLFRELKVRNSLAESIIWNAQTQTLWWTDIHSKKIYRSQWPLDTVESWSTPERLCSFGFTNDSEKLIAAFETGFAFYFPTTGALEWIARPELTFTGTRFNDGRVDRNGNFWSGTLLEGKKPLDANGNPAVASIYCLSGSHCEKKISGLFATNSLCWSLDGQRLFYADSPSGEIRTLKSNELNANPSVFIKTPEGAYPDGSIVDAENYLWNAQWLGGKVTRYSPDGKIDVEIKVPASQATCMCFAGPNLDYLCISTATENFTQAQLDAEPQAGNIFIYKTPWRGLTEVLFKETEDFFKE